MRKQRDFQDHPIYYLHMDCARGKPYTNSETLSGMCQNDPYTFLINRGYNVSQKHFGTRAKYRR